MVDGIRRQDLTLRVRQLNDKVWFSAPGFGDWPYPPSPPVSPYIATPACPSETGSIAVSMARDRAP